MASTAPSGRRVILVAFHDRKIPPAVKHRPNPQKRQRLPANIHRNDLAARANRAGKFEGEVTRAASKIHNDTPFPQVQVG
jgi:hypothetical protein